MVRHLFITLEYPPQRGGVSRYMANVVRALPHELVTVLALPCADGDEDIGRRAATVMRAPLLSAWMWPRWLPLAQKVLRVVRKKQIGLLHVGQVLPVGTAVWLATRFSKTPYIVYSHGMDMLLPRASRVKRWLARRILRGAERVITNTEYTKGLVGWFGVSHEKIIVLRPGCSVDADVKNDDAKRYGASLGLSGMRVILSAGRLVVRKGFDTLIAAFALVKEQLPDLHVVIVGGGPDRQRLELLVAHHHLANRVHFLGSVSDRQLKSLYRLCTAFVMVSRAEENGRDVEGFGMVYVEANAFGKPVIAGRTGGVAEAVVDGVTGLVVDPHSVEQTAQAMKALCSDRAFAQKLGEAGRLRAIQEFTWEVTMKPFIAWLASFEQAQEVRR